MGTGRVPIIRSHFLGALVFHKQLVFSMTFQIFSIFAGVCSVIAGPFVYFVLEYSYSILPTNIDNTDKKTDSKSEKCNYVAVLKH